MLEELRNHVAQKIGPIAKPANVIFTPELPKTRRTLADPAVVEEITSGAEEETAQEES
jgi:acyl-coenzyme A synthetase/AMP-(fatty) acid ligase